MSKKSLADRAHALEERFFQELEAQKIAKLRDELGLKSSRDELKSASFIEEDGVVDSLLKLDVGAKDLSALALVPLVQVAWADSSINEKERAAVLEAAHRNGVREGSHGHELLEAWLVTKPSRELFSAWQGYVEALLSHLSESEAEALKESILGLAHDVATAAGGIMGIGAISPAEKAILTSIEATFGA